MRLNTGCKMGCQQGLEDWEAREGSVTTIGSTKIKSTESGSVETWSSEGSGILLIG